MIFRKSQVLLVFGKVRSRKKKQLTFNYFFSWLNSWQGGSRVYLVDGRTSFELFLTSSPGVPHKVSDVFMLGYVVAQEAGNRRLPGQKKNLRQGRLRAQELARRDLLRWWSPSMMSSGLCGFCAGKRKSRAIALLTQITKVAQVAFILM